MSGGKGGKSYTIGYWYRLGVQMAICHAPVDSITQMAFGEKTAWTGKVTSNADVKIDAKELFGGEKREGGVAGRVGVCFGDKLQDVDRYVKSQRGDTSAQRGILTLVFGDSGSLDRTSTGAINFQMSTVSDKFEAAAGVTPTGILTNANAEMTRQQAETYISKFYSFPVNQYNDDGLIDPLGDLYKVYGSWRSVAMVFAYRYYVLGQLPDKSGASGRGRYTVDTFFNVIQRDSVKVSGGNATVVKANGSSEPFFWAAMNPYFKKVWVRVQNIYKGWTANGGNCWYESKAAIQGTSITTDNGKTLEMWDMNPAHIIYNVLTNNVWGMGYDVSDIDEASFKAAADKLYDEKFGLSMVWRREEVIEEFVNIILKTIDAYLRINVTSGKFELLLIRAQEDTSTLPVLDENCIMELTKYDRSAWGNNPNELTVTYRDRNEDSVTVTVQNLAAVDIQGGTIGTTAEYVGIHETELAARVAQRDLLVSTTPLAKVEMNVNRLAFLLQVGDCFVFKWKNLGIESMVMRITSINKGVYDDGTITIEAIEDIFAMPQTTYVKAQEVAWSQPSTTVTPVRYARAMEASYFDLVNIVGEENAKSEQYSSYTYGRLLAAQTDSGYDVFDLYADNVEVNSGTSYAKLAELAAPLTAEDIVLYIDSAAAILSKLKETGTYLVIDDEIMVLSELLNSDGSVIKVYRGCYDTVPTYHAAGAKVWVVSYADGLDPTQRVLGQTVKYKPLPRTTGTKPLLTNQTEWVYNFIGRVNRPYPVGYVSTSNSSFKRSDDLRLLMYSRNKKRAVLQAWGHQNLAADTGVTTYVKLYDNATNNLVKTLTSTDGSLQFASVNYVQPPTILDEINLSSVDGLILHQSFAKSKLQTNGKMNPTVGSGQTSFKDFSTGADVTNTTTLGKHFRKGVLGDEQAFSAIERGTYNERYAVLPYVAGVNSLNLTISCRFFNDGRVPVYYLGTADAPRLRIVSNGSTIHVVLGKRGAIYSNGLLDLSFEVTPNYGKWVDLIVSLDNTNSKVHVWVNGERYTKPCTWSNAHTDMVGTEQTENGGVIGKMLKFNDYAVSETCYIDSFWILSRALNESEIVNVGKMVQPNKWPQQLRIEAYTEQNGLTSWQTYKEVVDMS